MTYRKRKKQCKRRLEQRQRLTESQKQFCYKNRLNSYVLRDTAIGFSVMGEALKNSFQQATKHITQMGIEASKRLREAMTKID